MNGEWSDSRPGHFTSVEEQWYAMRRSCVYLGPGLSLCNKPIVPWKYYHSFSALSERTVIYLRVTSIGGSIWERYIQSAMQSIKHLPKTCDPAEMFCRVRDVTFGYSFVFQSFWYFRTIFIKLFVPEYLSEVTYWIFLKGPRYWDKYNQRSNWVRKVQNRFLRKVAGKVRHYQTSVFHTVRHYKPRLKNILNLNNKQAR
jgi:hypothetical protein